MKNYIYIFTFLFTISAFGEELLQSRAIIQSIDRTIISSEIGGRIIVMPKANGDYFKKGETLIKIDCDIYKAEREKIRVKRNLAKIKLDKNIQLKKYNSVGKFDVETSKLELQEEDLNYAIANINVNRCEIKAPYSGRIVEKIANRYQNIKPQEELLEIVNSDYLEIKAVVPALWLSWLKIGQDISIKIDELNIEVKSKILQIDSVVDPKSQTVNLRAKIDSNGKIIAGMSGTVSFSQKLN